MGRQKKDWNLTTVLSVVGFLFELLKVVVSALRKRGGTIDHLRRLLMEPELVDQVFNLIVRALFPSEVYALELIPEYEDDQGERHRWKIVQDVEFPPSSFKTTDLEPISFLKEGDEEFIGGRKLVNRAATLQVNNQGLCHVKVVLDNQESINVELREFYLVFTGTVLMDQCGDLWIPVIYFSPQKGRWCVNFRFIDHGFGGKHDRLVRSKLSLTT